VQTTVAELLHDLQTVGRDSSDEATCVNYVGDSAYGLPSLTVFREQNNRNLLMAFVGTVVPRSGPPQEP
jgi:hypothetical protein